LDSHCALKLSDNKLTLLKSISSIKIGVEKILYTNSR